MACIPLSSKAFWNVCTNLQELQIGLEVTAKCSDLSGPFRRWGRGGEKENKKHWGRGRKGIGVEEERKRKSGKEESKRDAKVSEVFRLLHWSGM